MTKPISEATLWEVAQNAIRYINEADEQYKKRRFASALSAAVLSIEETGKLAFLRVDGKYVKYKHQIKQNVFAGMLVIVSSFLWNMIWQRVLQEGLEPNAPLSADQQAIVKEHPEFAEFVEKLRAGEFPDMQARLAAYNKPLMALLNRNGPNLDPFFKGQLHDLRMRATYVDIGDNGEILSDPTSVTSESAESICLGAVVLLRIIICLMLPSRWDEFENALPKDFTGKRSLDELYEKTREWFGALTVEDKQKVHQWLQQIAEQPWMAEMNKKRMEQWIQKIKGN